MMNNVVKTPEGATVVYQGKRQGFTQAFFSSFGLTELGIGTVLGLGVCIAAGTSAASFSGPALLMSVIISLLMFR
jgi:hypothetical protein